MRILGQNSAFGSMKDDGHPANRPAGMKLAFRFALRELRGGLAGFYVFLACIALGVAAITGVNSVADSIRDGISSQGMAILGGDMAFSKLQQQLSTKERQFVSELGEVSDIATLRAMARHSSGNDQTMVELKAVDPAWPLYGKFSSGTTSLEPSFSLESKPLKDDEALVDPLLLERLGVKIGGQFTLGTMSFTIRDTIDKEPDRMSEGIGFGPRVIITLRALAKTGLVQPGSLIRYITNVKIPDASSQTIKSVEKTAKLKFPESGWRIRTRDNAAPALSRNVERFTQFLTLVGLTALVVGGVGVANATRAFLETRRQIIAALKAMGASGGFVFRLYLLQILMLATIGIVAGVIIGVTLPLMAKSALTGLVPVASGFTLYPGPIAIAVVFGLVTAATFALLPLGRAREISPSTLFRSQSYEGNFWPSRDIVFMLIILIATLAGLAIFTAESRSVSIVFVCAIALSFVMLRGMALVITYLAKKAPRINSTELRMAVTNIHRRGSLTPSVVLSLGLGLALLVTIATIDGNLRQQVSGNLPKQAPDFFFVDIQNNEIDGFRNLLHRLVPDGKLIMVPMLRGKITVLKGIAAEDYKAAEGGEWVLRGDRGITYTNGLPENSTLAAGKWWPPDYSGAPLVSFSKQEADELGLKIGDRISVNVLGRTIEAEISSLRQVNWETLGINFVMVFSPNTFAGAPHSWLSTLLVPQKDKAGISDGKLLKELTKAYPMITTVTVRDALNIINTLIAQLANAIRAAASVALIASVLVLAGALASGNRNRIHDAVVLKTLGATRGTLIRAFVYEYAILGLATAVFAIVAGSLAAWYVIAGIMEFPFVLMPSVAFLTVALATLLTVGLGLVGTWRILGIKSAPFLREL